MTQTNRPDALHIATARMRLVALDPELARLQIEDRPGFFAALDVAHESVWPPELHSRSSLDQTRAALEAGPSETGWRAWVFIMSWSLGAQGGASKSASGRLVGMGGFHGPPDADGAVEIAYAMLPSFREQGLATEAVQGLTDWALRAPGVTRIVARTAPHQEASRRVLEKTGFTRAGDKDGATLHIREKS